jgi:hypothetical protein
MIITQFFDQYCEENGDQGNYGTNEGRIKGAGEGGGADALRRAMRLSSRSFDEGPESFCGVVILLPATRTNRLAASKTCNGRGGERIRQGGNRRDAFQPAGIQCWCRKGTYAVSTAPAEANAARWWLQRSSETSFPSLGGSRWAVIARPSNLGQTGISRVAVLRFLSASIADRRALLNLSWIQDDSRLAESRKPRNLNGI